MSPAAKPVVERIAEALVAVLAAVTVENGCQVTVAEVARPKRLEEFVPRDGVVVLAQGDPDEDGELEGAGGIKAWVQPFSLHCFLQVSDRDPTPLDARANLFRAEVEKAVRTDPTLGGLATDLRVRPSDSWIFKPNRAFEGITVNVDVHYRHREDDPFALA